ncbi:MAG TPA: Gfo/Idh/MocA family oxidoreductase [Candidatus Alistipes cottocaccae]|nr:Gfo/Idh/MocA family oxidoreductase [Candidatus Alistipes cottocaccae]
MEEVKWGILGCGNVCERKSGPPMYRTEHSSLTAVMRRDAAKAADFARRHGVPRFYTDAAELIADPEVNIVYVATPHATHRELTIRALEAGKPVYVEKPMAMNHAECLEMIAAAEKYGQKLFVAYYRRALPYFLKVRELLEAGRIGTPQRVEVRYIRSARPEDRDREHLPWRLRREIGGEGYFCDMAPHTLDILDFLLGEIAEARGEKRNTAGLYDVADTVSAEFRFRSGAVGTGLWRFTALPEETGDSVLVTGSRGSIRFSTFAFTPIELATPQGCERFAIAPPEHIQGPLIRTIVAELRGEGQCPSTGISAARTSWVMDAILKE